MMWLLPGLAISQASSGEVSFSLAHLFVRHGDAFQELSVLTVRQLGPLPGVGLGTFIPKCIGFLPVEVSADTAVFSALALCLYLGQAYFNSTGTRAGLRPPSGPDPEKYWVGSAQLSC